MDNKISYDSGDRIFKYGEAFFMNSCYESSEHHLHAHNFIEIAYVAAGNGIHSIGGKHYEVSEGDLFLINYDIPHEFRSLLEETGKKMLIYNCVFKPEFIDASLINSRCFSDIFHIFLFRSIFEEDAGESDIYVLRKVSPEIRNIFVEMLHEFSVKEYGYIEILRAYLIGLLVKIFRLYRHNKSMFNNENQKKYFDGTIEFMKSHYKEDIRVEELAAMSFLSRNYFCASFKECAGVTVLEYIQKLRIEEACNLLRDKCMKIADIAEAVGYKDVKFFNRIFKKFKGKSPSEYRKTLESNPAK